MNWRVSTHSVGNGACVECATFWKSSHSMSNGNCLEAGVLHEGTVFVRDTKQEALGTERTVLAFSPATWTGFITRIKGT